jgi:hypothetical protein
MLSMKAAAFHKLDRNESSGAYSLHDFYGGGRIHPGQSCFSMGVTLTLSLIPPTMHTAGI